MKRKKQTVAGVYAPPARLKLWVPVVLSLILSTLWLGLLAFFG